MVNALYKIDMLVFEGQLQTDDISRALQFKVEKCVKHLESNEPVIHNIFNFLHAG